MRLRDRVGEFLALYARGLCDREIARAMGICRDSVRLLRFRLRLPPHSAPGRPPGRGGRPRVPKTPAERSRQAQARAGYNVYFARPTLGDVPDLLVEVVGGRRAARDRARRLNASLPPTQDFPCEFYYAAHGRDLLDLEADYDRLLDLEAEGRLREAEEAV